MLLSHSRCSQAPLELGKVLSDSAWAFPGVSESTCSSRGAFQKLHYLTYRIGNCWVSWDICASPRETSRAAETSAYLCWWLYTWCCLLTAEVPRVPYYKPCCVSYCSLSQSHDSLHSNMAFINYLILSIYIDTVNLAADGKQVQSGEHPVMLLRSTLRCTWMLWSSEFGCELWAKDQVNSEMLFEVAVIETLGCTCRKWPSEFADTLGDSDQVSLEIHWRPPLSNLGGYNDMTMEIHLEAVIMWIWRCTWRQWLS